MSLLDSIIVKGLKVVAPTIASLLGTPFAGIAISALSEVLFGHDKASEKDIAKGLEKASPEIWAKLKEKDMDVKVKIAAMELDQEKLEAMKVELARKFALAQQKTGKTDWQRLAFVTAAYIFLAVLIFFTIRSNLTASLQGLMMLVIGRALGWVDGAYQFYFGTSKGSANKDNVIADQLNNKGKL